MRKIFFSLLLLGLLTFFAASAFVGWQMMSPLGHAETVRVRIPPGASLGSIAQQLQRAGVPLPTFSFKISARLSGRAGRVRSGTYRIFPGQSSWVLLDRLIRGEIETATIRFVEGWTFRQMQAVIDAHPDLDHTLAGETGETIMAELGLAGTHPEGRFFPDTYRFDVGAPDIEIYRRSAAHMKALLDEAWASRDKGLPYRTPDEALIMASIIEKETAINADRGLVAAVFVNRLRKGMLLQTDPTVIYGLGERFDGNLRRHDLKTDTPYNTYTRAGLPPSPIALPGREAIEAALHPETSKVLYFVARGDGTSAFSHTLAEHNRAVNRYQRGR